MGRISASAMATTMPGTVLDERFEAAMRGLTEMHAEATLYRASAEAAERAFGHAMRIGAAVRRAVRQGKNDRPNEADCEDLEATVTRLGGALSGVAELPAVGALRTSLENGEHEHAAELALSLFAELGPAVPAPPYGYRGVPLRARRRGGESILAPEDLAQSLLARVATGLEVESSDRSPQAISAGPQIPTPIVLSPSLDGCGSELSVRVDLGCLRLPVLRHSATGDLWILAKGPIVPLEIAAAAEAEDEWWAASPIPYRAYLARLARTLAQAEVAFAIEGEIASG